jgi:hypothetical protein
MNESKAEVRGFLLESFCETKIFRNKTLDYCISQSQLFQE